MLKHLKEERKFIIDDDYMLSVSQQSRGSVASSASTHRGGSLHIAGFGEAHDFRYDEDDNGGDKFRMNINDTANRSNSLMDSERESDFRQGQKRSGSFNDLNRSRDSNGNPLTEKQKGRIQEKMRRKHE